MNSMLMVYLCNSIAFFDKLYGIFCQGRAKDDVLEPHWRHCVVSLSKNINPTVLEVEVSSLRRDCAFS